MKNTIKIITLLICSFALYSTASAGTDAFIRRNTLKKSPVSGYRMIAEVSDKVKGLTAVKATIAAKDKESPTPQITNFTMKVVGTTEKGNYQVQADFACEKGICLFKTTDNPVGKTYTITVTYLDSAEKQIGSSESFNVDVELQEVKAVKVTAITLEGLNYFAPNTAKNSEENVLLTKNKSSETGYHLCFETELLGGAKLYSPTPEEVSLTAKIVIFDAKTSKTTTYNTPATYNPKKKRYESDLTFDDSYVRTISVDIRVVGGGDNPSYEIRANEKGFFRILSVENGNITCAVNKIKDQTSGGGNTDSSNTCSNTVKLGQTACASLTSQNGISIISVDNVSFTNSKEAPVALTSTATVQLTACDGSTVYIALPLSYNEKTKTYSVAKALSSCTSGQYYIEGISLKGTDACGNTYIYYGGPSEKRVGLCCMEP